MCTKRTFRFIVRWYEVLVIFSLLIICLIGIEKMAFLGSGCCRQTGFYCCEVEELLPINVTLPVSYEGESSAMLCVDRPPSVKLENCLTRPGNPSLEDCLAPAGYSEPQGFTPSKCLRDRTVFEGCMCVVGLMFASLLLFSECLLEIEPPTETESNKASEDNTSSKSPTNPTAERADELEDDTSSDANGDGNGASAKPPAPAAGEPRDLCGPIKLVSAHILRLHRSCVRSCEGRFFGLFGIFKYNLGRAVVFTIAGTLLMLVAASHEALESEGTEDDSWFLVFLEGVFCQFVAFSLVVESLIYTLFIAPKRAIKSGIQQGQQRMKDRSARRKSLKEGVELTDAERLEEGSGGTGASDGQQNESGAQRRLTADYQDEEANPMHGVQEAAAAAPLGDSAAEGGSQDSAVATAAGPTEMV
jgi:hypothetical protein